MNLSRIVRFFKAKLRAIIDWCALRILMLVEHEPSDDRVELLVEPTPHKTIRVCLPTDQILSQIRSLIIAGTAHASRPQF